jgi:hypothetical protein
MKQIIFVWNYLTFCRHDQRTEGNDQMTKRKQWAVMKAPSKGNAVAWVVFYALISVASYGLAYGHTIEHYKDCASKHGMHNCLVSQS